METQILRAVKMSEVLTHFELDDAQIKQVRFTVYDLCGATPDGAALHTLMGNHQFLVELMDSLGIFDVEERTDLENKFWGVVLPNDYVDIEQ